MTHIRLYNKRIQAKLFPFYTYNCLTKKLSALKKLDFTQFALVLTY